MLKFVRKNIARPVLKFVLGDILARALSRLRTEHRDRVPDAGPVLMAANHVSWSDPVFLTVASPRPVRFLVTEGFYRKPFVNFFSCIFECIPIRKNHPREAIVAAIKALREGDAVLIFPEGGLTHDGSLREIKRGFEIIARRSECPVIPVAVDGLYGTALAVRREWKKRDLRTKPWPRVRIKFGEPIPPENATPELVALRLAALLRTNSIGSPNE